jgi:thymidine kinase
MVPRAYPVGTGWIEVITGCMFSGKTEELIRRLNRARYATQRVVVFKPAVDTRYAVGDVVSHSEQTLRCEPVDHAHDILKQVGDAQVVGIDEAQFFDDVLVGVCGHLANLGKRVIVAGLDMDYRGVPFGPMPELLAVAEKVHKIHAICTSCGSPAAYTQRLIESDELVVVGATGAYEARCRRCHEPEGAPPASEPWLFQTTEGADREPES